MRRAILCILLLALAGPGCDTASARWSRAERPEGWESIEGEAAATRLYYQFVDASRRVRFVERLEDVPEDRRADVGFVKLDVPPPLSPGDAARVRNARRQERAGGSAGSAGPASARIVLYSAEWCGACRKAKRYMTRNGIDFELRDVDEPRFAEELRRKTGARAVPVIDVNGRVLTGFSPDDYDELIDRA